MVQTKVNSDTMEALEKSREGFSVAKAALKDLIRQETKLDVKEIHPTDLAISFGYQRFEIIEADKRATFDLYATGQIVFNFDRKLDPKEKTSSNTSQVFRPVDLVPSTHNHINLYIKNQDMLFIKKIKEHFSKD